LRIIVEGHGRVVAVEQVHLGHVGHRRDVLHVGHVLHGGHGRIAAHRVQLAALAVTLIRGAVHTHSTRYYYRKEYLNSHIYKPVQQQRQRRGIILVDFCRGIFTSMELMLIL